MNLDIATIPEWLARIRARYPRLPQFIALCRLNNPIGTLLLLWPTLWGLWFATKGWPGWHLFFVFTLGTLLARSAGCIVNDIADRHFDGHVTRTRERPLARGVIKVEEAIVLMAGLLFLALLLVLSTNLHTLLLAVAAALIAATYPFMKRFTYLPQVVLGVAFSCGIPMAFTAATGDIPRLAWLLVLANTVWTVAYDTEYAMVDRDDDIRLGLKSSAILFADMDKLMIGLLQSIFLVVLIMAGRLVHTGPAYYFGLAVAAGLMVYQQFLIKDRDREGCFLAFLNNHWVGVAVFAGIAINLMVA